LCQVWSACRGEQQRNCQQQYHHWRCAAICAAQRQRSTMAVAARPERIAEWLGSMSSCISLRSLNRLKQEVLSRRVAGREFSIMVNECRLFEIVGEDITGRDAARLRKAWHSDFPDSLNLKGQTLDKPVTPPTDARGNPIVTHWTQPPAQPPQSSARSRMVSGDVSPRVAPVAQGGCGTAIIAMMIDRLARWAGFDRLAALEEVRDVLSESVQEELRVLFLDMPAMSPRIAGLRQMNHPTSGDNIHASLTMELERVKLEAVAHRAQAQMATQQSEFDRVQAQASMQKVQLELERLQVQASSQQVQAARDNLFGLGSPRSDGSPMRHDASPTTSANASASSPDAAQVRKQEYERQEIILQEQQRQLEVQRRQFEQDRLVKQQKAEQHPQPQRDEDAASGRAGWAVVGGVYSDPASAALAAAAVHSPAARDDPHPVSTLEPNREDRFQVPFALIPAKASSASRPPPLEPTDTSGREPTEIATWVRSLPDSQVPEAQREALAASIEQQSIYGGLFTDLAGKSSTLVEYGLSSPQQAVKVRRAWEQVLREDECKQVAIENAHGTPSPKAVKMVL